MNRLNTRYNSRSSAKVRHYNLAALVAGGQTRAEVREQRGRGGGEVSFLPYKDEPVRASCPLLVYARRNGNGPGLVWPESVAFSMLALVGLFGLRCN